DPSSADIDPQNAPVSRHLRIVSYNSSSLEAACVPRAYMAQKRSHGPAEAGHYVRPGPAKAASLSHVVSAFRRTVVGRASTFRLTLTTSLVLLATTGLLTQEADRAAVEALSQRAAERLQGLQREADR